MGGSGVGRRWRVGLGVVVAVLGLAVAAAVGAVAATSQFSDVPANHPHAVGIGWVAEAQVTAGCRPGAYCPSDPVTRAQMATFMRRLAGHDPLVAPSVDAATVQGLGPAQLQAPLVARLDALEAADAAQAATIAALAGQVADLEGEVAALQDEVDGLETLVAAQATTIAAQADTITGLEALLAGVSRVTVDGQPTLRFAGMNVQVVNGTGSTAGDPNGRGNLLIGYSAQRPSPASRVGSHYLVVGDEHQWTRFGGIVVGLDNTATGDYASVSGGAANTASGTESSVSGGNSNTASGFGAAVSGGFSNTASGDYASVSGGAANTASGTESSVSGGWTNAATGIGASVSGGSINTASGTDASVSGGQSNQAEAGRSSILGGILRTVSTSNGCFPSCA